MEDRDFSDMFWRIAKGQHPKEIVILMVFCLSRPWLFSREGSTAFLLISVPSSLGLRRPGFYSCKIKENLPLVMLKDLFMFLTSTRKPPTALELFCVNQPFLLQWFLIFKEGQHCFGRGRRSLGCLDWYCLENMQQIAGADVLLSL